MVKISVHRPCVLWPAPPRLFFCLQVLEICDSDFKKLVRTPVFLSELHIITIFYNLLCGIKYLSKSGARRRKGARTLVRKVVDLPCGGLRVRTQ